MTSFTPHLNVLPAAQRAIWPALAGCRALGFVLYGGTAIAVRLGHRVSVDFDLFTAGSPSRGDLAEALPLLREASVIQEDRQTVVYLTSPERLQQSVKLSFFSGIKFGRIGMPALSGDGVCEVASLDDLLATKLKVILQRAEAKDYRDIAVRLAHGTDLAKGLASAQALYGDNFQPSEALKALSYFEDGDLRDLSKSEKEGLTAASASIKQLPRIRVISNNVSALNATGP